MRQAIAWLVVLVVAVSGVYLRMDHVHEKRLRETAEAKFGAGELSGGMMWDIWRLENENQAILENAETQASRRVSGSSVELWAGCESRSVAFKNAVEASLGCEFPRLKERASSGTVTSGLREISTRRQLRAADKELRSRLEGLDRVNKEIRDWCRGRGFEIETKRPVRWSKTWA